MRRRALNLLPQGAAPAWRSCKIRVPRHAGGKSADVYSWAPAACSSVHILVGMQATTAGLGGRAKVSLSSPPLLTAHTAARAHAGIACFIGQVHSLMIVTTARSSILAPSIIFTCVVAASGCCAAVVQSSNSAVGRSSDHGKQQQ